MKGKTGFVWLVKELESYGDEAFRDVVKRAFGQIYIKMQMKSWCYHKE